MASFLKGTLRSCRFTPAWAQVLTPRNELLLDGDTGETKTCKAEAKLPYAIVCTSSIA
jgi:hypothetical protein